MSVPTKISKSQVGWCKFIPLIEPNYVKQGIPITFKVVLQDHNDLKNTSYSLLYNQNHWLLSGASTGYLKVIFSLNMLLITHFKGNIIF